MPENAPTPPISVVTSVFNGERFLHEAIRSILNQTFAEFEFILINDGSTDHTPALLADWAKQDARLVLVHNETNLGLTKSLNKAIRLARGSWIARQDADDLSHPQRLAKQLAFLQHHPEIGLLGTGAWYGDLILEPDPYLKPANHVDLCWQVLFQNPFFHTSVMFRRDLALGCPYDESVRYAQDFELWGRFLKITQGANLTEPLVTCRRHAERISAVHCQQQQKLGLEIVQDRLQALLPNHAWTLQEIQAVRALASSSWPIPGETGQTGMLLLRLFQAFVQQNQAFDCKNVRVRLLVRLWRSVLASSLGDGLTLAANMGKLAGWGITGNTLIQLIHQIYRGRRMRLARSELVKKS